MAVQKWVENDRFLLRISLRNGHSLAIHANTNVQCEWTLRHRKLLLSLSCDGHVVSLPQMDTFQCSCPSGFTGQRCQHNVNECDVMPCQNGTCRDQSDSRICDCFQGYTGSLLTHMYTHTWSQDLRVFPGIHRFVTYTHVYKHTWSQDLRVFPGIHRFVTYTHVHAHMITGSASVSRDTQVRYLHTCTCTHDHRICECFQGYTGSLLTHTCIHTWSQDLRLFPGIHRFVTYTHVYKHTWSQDLRVFPGIHRFVTYTHVHAHMIAGSASVSRDTQVRYLHTCTCTHDHRICECFQGYTGSLLTHTCIHTWSQDLRVFPGIHRFVTNTHKYTHMITGSASVSRDTQVRYLHTRV